MAVDRVEYLYLYPSSFMEFLTVSDRNDLRQCIMGQRVDPGSKTYPIKYAISLPGFQTAAPFNLSSFVSFNFSPIDFVKAQE